jgi:hypothetical protein
MFEAWVVARQMTSTAAGRTGDTDGACALYRLAIQAYPRSLAARANLAVPQPRLEAFQEAMRILAETFYEIEE